MVEAAATVLAVLGVACACVMILGVTWLFILDLTNRG